MEQGKFTTKQQSLIPDVEVERENLRVLAGKAIEITGVTLQHSNKYGEYMQLSVKEGGYDKDYYTFAKVVIEQLKAVEAQEVITSLKVILIKVESENGKAYFKLIDQINKEEP